MPNANQPPLNNEQVHGLVEEGLLEAMRDLGLNPTIVEPQHASDKRSLATQFEHLFIVPGTASLMESEGVCAGCQIALEVFYEDPKGNKGVIPQLASRFGNGLPPTETEAIETVTRDWVKGTLPPLCKLFGAVIGEPTGRLALESYTEGDEEMTLWEGFFGPVQSWGDESLRQKINVGTPYGLIHNTLTNYYPFKYLHWIEINGTRYPNGKTQIKVEIHGLEDAQANAEANYQFDWTPFPNPCSFRQFFVIRPCGSKPLAEADAELTQAMQEQGIDTTPGEQREPTSEPAPPSGKTRFRWPFGRRS